MAPALRRKVSRAVAEELPHPVRRARHTVPGPRRVTSRAVAELDDRLGLAKSGTSSFLNHVFPDHWSFMLGEVALYSFVLLVATGVFLTFYYTPSSTHVIYHGTFAPLRGERVSDAFQSAMQISFSVRAGLFVRQMHHWAADVFIGSIVVHMARVFFTSAYRKPRDLNWTIGITMLGLAIFNGYFGYSLPDDLLSGTGVRIGYGIIESIPFVGEYIATFGFGGNFPGDVYLRRFYIAHVFILPLLIAGLLVAHLLLIFRQEHTQFPGAHKTERNVVGQYLWPNFVAKTTGLLLMTAAVLGVLAGTAQIDPIWQTGPYDPTKLSTAAQPDWYMGWLEGALRLMPSWEWSAWGHTVPWSVFFPGVVLPAGTFLLFYVWPAVERFVTRDQSWHQLLVPPRRRPTHTAVGAGVFAFYFMLFLAGSDDVLANFLHLSLNGTVWSLRVLLFAVPLAVGFVTYRVCRELVGRPDRRRQRLRLAHGSYAVVPAYAPPSDGDGRGPLEVPDAIEGIGRDGHPKVPAPAPPPPEQPTTIA